MRNLQQELEFEQEQAVLRAGFGSAEQRQGSGSLGAQPAGRQAAFSAGLEAAAGGAQPGDSAHGRPGDAAGGGADPAPPPFATMLEEFLEGAASQRSELEGVGAATSATVRATVAWLGEPAGGDQELATAFEMLYHFCAAFDACCRKVHRLMQAAAAS